MLFNAKPVVSNARPLAERQVDEVSGMTAAERLRLWILVYDDMIASWAKTVSQQPPRLRKSS
jgi:hypothetical protein